MIDKKIRLIKDVKTQLKRDVTILKSNFHNKSPIITTYMSDERTESLMIHLNTLIESGFETMFNRHIDMFISEIETHMNKLGLKELVALHKANKKNVRGTYHSIDALCSHMSHMLHTG